MEVENKHQQENHPQKISRVIAVKQNKNFKRIAQHLLLILATDRKDFWTSCQVLQEITGWGRSKIKSTLGELVKDGYVETQRRRVHGRNDFTEYRISEKATSTTWTKKEGVYVHDMDVGYVHDVDTKVLSNSGIKKNSPLSPPKGGRVKRPRLERQDANKIDQGLLELYDALETGWLFQPSKNAAAVLEHHFGGDYRCFYRVCERMRRQEGGLFITHLRKILRLRALKTQEAGKRDPPEDLPELLRRGLSLVGRDGVKGTAI